MVEESAGCVVSVCQRSRKPNTERKLALGFVEALPIFAVAPLLKGRGKGVGLSLFLFPLRGIFVTPRGCKISLDFHGDKCGARANANRTCSSLLSRSPHCSTILNGSAKLRKKVGGLRMFYQLFYLKWNFFSGAVIWSFGHLSKSKTDCQNPPL